VCELYELPAQRVTSNGTARSKMTAATSPVGGQRYYQECHTEGMADEAGRVITYVPPGPALPAPDPAQLAADAYQRVPLVAPLVRTSPPVGSPQLVGLATWLWVEPGAWAVFDATAEVPGLSVTVTATPTSVRWDMGDGTQVTCTGPGTPWVEGGPEHSDCTHTYQFVSAGEPGGRYTVSATVTWAVSWEAPALGLSGTLADATRTGTAQLEVAERQAVITYGRP
jgi:hypothetical protein